MTSQLAQSGDVGLVATVAGLNTPLIVASAPTTQVPNSPFQLAVTTSGVVYQYNGTSWNLITSNAPLQFYIAMLTVDPVAAGATTISQLTECQTAGYSRQAVTWSTPTATYPSSSTNSNLLTFGPMATTMTVPVQWAALVTVQSGTTGYFLASWLGSASQQVDASESFYCGIGQLVLQGQ